MKISTEDHGEWRDGRGRQHTEWSAITDDYDGAPDAHSPIGRGETEAEAIEDLMQQIEERAA